ncbi:hypothetical protein N7G274_008547 [Stereocaulon virgatum]|uniref:Uncharacterized protein n=1 Tax=Stereocaulon virgatum TaxID=373712 RepID=A0ABR3ZYM7_9LECA
MASFPNSNRTLIRSSNITNAPPDFPFAIEGCGDYTGNMVQILSLALSHLPLVIYDTRNGVRSPYGFKAWFKSDEVSTYVRQILWSIATAQTLKGLMPEPKIPTAPRFACITPATIHLYSFLPPDWGLQCDMLGQVASFYLGGSSYIFICPYFWHFQVVPPRRNCPSVVRNEFRGDYHSNFAEFSMYIIIHEMVHFYLGTASLSPQTKPPETYPINDVVALNIEDSIHNPMNYQYYLAMVLQSCIAFPNPDRPPFSPVQRNGTEAGATTIASAIATQSLTSVSNADTEMDIPSATTW